MCLQSSHNQFAWMLLKYVGFMDEEIVYHLQELSEIGPDKGKI